MVGAWNDGGEVDSLDMINMIDMIFLFDFCLFDWGVRGGLRFPIENLGNDTLGWWVAGGRIDHPCVYIFVWFSTSYERESCAFQFQFAVFELTMASRFMLDENTHCFSPSLMLF